MKLSKNQLKTQNYKMVEEIRKDVDIVIKIQ